MKKSLTAILAASALSAAGQAQFHPDGAPDERATHTAAQALEAHDETPVVLVGRIVERIRDEQYRFRDESGEIRLDVGEEIWRGAQVGPETLVRVTGEIDRGLRSVDIWVHAIETVDSGEDG